MDNTTPEEDRKAFTEAMDDVAPLGRRSRSDRANSPPPAPVARPSQAAPIPISALPPARPIDGREILNWRRAGLRDKDYQNLRRGKLTPTPREIDLHGLTSQEAFEAILQAIAVAQQADRQTLCLIHGKGHRSEEGRSRLKGLADAALRQHPEVLGFHSVPHNTGAVNVLLRKPRR